MHFLFLAINLLLLAFLEKQMGFLPLHDAPSYPMSPPLLAQGPPMSAGSSSRTTGIFVPTLWPP